VVAEGGNAQRRTPLPAPTVGGRVYRDILECIGNTPLVELKRFSPKPGVRIFAKLEGHNPTGSLKDRIALYMIRAAEESGELTPDKTILEPTSGNTGISLAMVARVKGYRLVCVLPDNVTPEREQLIRSFGAEVVYARGARSTNDAIALAQRMLEEAPDRYYMPYQYGNVHNPRAHYETTAEEIIRDLPEVDVFVAGLGTGGTLTGVGRRLKEYNPNIKVVATVPHPGDLVQGLRSLDEGFIPPVLDESVLDGRFVVDSRTSFAMTKELLEREGIFAGISSGAVLRTALKVAERLERGNIVCLLADGGWKYLSTGLWLKSYDDLRPEDVEGKVWW
jgi:cysteine synthase B